MTPEQTQELAALKAALKQHIEEAEKATPGPWDVSEQTGEANAIKHISGFICFTCAPSKPSDERIDGESWLDMRIRTQTQRDSVEITQKSNASFIARARTMSPLACRIALAGIEALEETAANDDKNCGLHFLERHPSLDHLAKLCQSWKLPEIQPTTP